MPQIINKIILKQLADLVRIRLTAKENDKFLKDLQKIVNYFKELKTVDTQGTEPMNGGTDLKDVFREDIIDFKEKAQSVNNTGRIVEAFPENDKGYLKIPKVL